MKLRNLDDAVVFLRVVELGGFSKAARELQVAPATVSKQIARFEQAMDARLFERNTRSVRLTSEGTQVAAHVREALAQLALAGEIAAKGRDALVGNLRITAPATFDRWRFAADIADFRRLHPAVEFELSLSDQVVDLPGSGYDLAIRAGDLPDSRLVARRLASSRRILVAAPEYLARHGAPTQPSDLARHDCLVFAYPGTSHDRWPLHNARRTADVRVTGSLRSDNGNVLREWCLAGSGISLRETWNIASDLRTGRLVQVLPDWEARAVDIHAVWRSRKQVPRRLTAFIDFLADRWQDPAAPHRRRPVRKSRRGA